MKQKIHPSIYKMATKAFHKTGDISESVPTICHVNEEDKNNFYGMWICGLGFAEVKFPKETTRNLTTEEIEEYHGKTYSIGDMMWTLNLKGENFERPIRLYKGDTLVKEGKLTSPIKVGGLIVIGNGWFHSSKIQEVNENKTEVKTRNSVYRIEYLD